MPGSIRQRTPGSWQIIWDEPSTDGKRKQKTMTIKGPKRDAQRKLREILQSIDDGRYKKETKQTVGDHLDFWLKTVEGTVAESSFVRYSYIVNKRLRPGLGALKLSALRPFDIQAMYKEWEEAGLSPRTIRLQHAVLRRALGAAVSWELISRNPALVVEPPRRDDYTPSIISDKDVASVLDAVKGTDYEGILTLAICTGMRRGELCALMWSDVDLEARRLSVHRTVNWLKGQLVISAPKTAGSRRMIDLPDSAVEMLASLPRNGPFVFPRPNGEPRAPSTVGSAAKRIFRALGLGISLHGLRHSHASWAMREGHSPKVVAERLGHSNPGFTMAVYSHTTPSMQRALADGMGKLLEREDDGDTGMARP
jgi:integrase